VGTLEDREPWSFLNRKETVQERGVTRQVILNRKGGPPREK